MAISICTDTHRLGRFGIGLFDLKVYPGKKPYVWFEMNFSQTEGHLWLEFVAFNHKLVLSWRLKDIYTH